MANLIKNQSRMGLFYPLSGVLGESLWNHSAHTGGRCNYLWSYSALLGFCPIIQISWSRNESFTFKSSNLPAHRLLTIRDYWLDETISLIFQYKNFWRMRDLWCLMSRCKTLMQFSGIRKITYKINADSSLLYWHATSQTQSSKHNKRTDRSC